MSGCCGAIHTMQQTGSRVLKKPFGVKQTGKCPLPRLATHVDG